VDPAFHAQTAGSTLTAQQPDNNVVRVSLQALAAVLGGCQSLHTNGREEALSLPTEASARIALRTQQIVAHESGVCDFIDPLGGSWALESPHRRAGGQGGRLPAQDRRDGWNGGGDLPPVSQREIEDAAYAAQKAVEEKQQIVVGVNEFAVSGEPPFETLRLDPELESRQVERLKAFRRKRDGSAATRALSDVKRAAEGTENVVPRIVAAVKARSTLGEIANAMREVFGEHGR